MGARATFKQADLDRAIKTAQANGTRCRWLSMSDPFIPIPGRAAPRVRADHRPTPAS